MKVNLQVIDDDGTLLRTFVIAPEELRMNLDALGSGDSVILRGTVTEMHSLVNPVTAPREYWRIRDAQSFKVLVTNLKSAEEAKNVAMSFASSTIGPGDYIWERQNGPESISGGRQYDL